MSDDYEQSRRVEEERIRKAEQDAQHQRQVEETTRQQQAEQQKQIERIANSGNPGYMG